MLGYPPPTLTPAEFEVAVRDMLDAMAAELTEYRSDVRERVEGQDGEYEIDVTARFFALGMEFLVLAECKHHKYPIKRDVLLALHSKMKSVGAQKGVVFSTSPFQSGALEYAAAHGIATIEVADGRTCYRTRSMEPSPKPVSWAGVPPVLGWLRRENRYSLVSGEDARYLAEALGMRACEI